MPKWKQNFIGQDQPIDRSLSEYQVKINRVKSSLNQVGRSSWIQTKLHLDQAKVDRIHIHIEHTYENYENYLKFN